MVACCVRSYRSPCRPPTKSPFRATARLEARDIAQRLPDGRIFAPKAAQRILAIRTLPAVEVDHRRSIEMAGRVVPDPNTSGFVQTAIGGRLLPTAGGFPAIGATVKVGDVMALVEPSLASADRSAMRQSKAELDQDIALAKQQLERLSPLAANGTVSRAQLEEAELTLQALNDRRAALDSLRMEAETLVAPVSGIVSKANAVSGLIAATNTEVFHVIAPSALEPPRVYGGGKTLGELPFMEHA